MWYPADGIGTDATRLPFEEEEEEELDLVGLLTDLKESIRQAQREDSMTQAIRTMLAGRP
jgi:hypothetical protein